MFVNAQHYVYDSKTGEFEPDTLYTINTDHICTINFACVNHVFIGLADGTKLCININCRRLGKLLDAKSLAEFCKEKEV